MGKNTMLPGGKSYLIMANDSLHHLSKMGMILKWLYRIDECKDDLEPIANKKARYHSERLFDTLDIAVLLIMLTTRKEE